jgi:hypothetical protein
MAIRFRRTIKLAPGLRLNFGKRGVSLSAGIRGLNLTLGKNGAFVNAGLPGTGLSCRERIGSTHRKHYTSQMSSKATAVDMHLQLKDDGSLMITADDGTTLSAAELKFIRTQRKDQIVSWLQTRVNALNSLRDELLAFHLETPSESQILTYLPETFDRVPPQRPVELTLGWFASRLPGRRRKVHQQNAQRQHDFEDAMIDWKNAEHEHSETESYRKQLIETKRYQAPDGIHEFLAVLFSGICWPRETLLNFEVSQDGRQISLDVNLPEIEDMPSTAASVLVSKLAVKFKTYSEIQLRKDYMQHIHAVLFRIAGEVFAAVPLSQSIVISGFSQRLNPQTGRTRDDYLISARIERRIWATLNFQDLETLSLTECFQLFDLRRDMTKTGIFRPILPYTTTTT